MSIAWGLGASLRYNGTKASSQLTSKWPKTAAKPRAVKSACRLTATGARMMLPPEVRIVLGERW
jgi:hypothetical protein